MSVPGFQSSDELRESLKEYHLQLEAVLLAKAQGDQESAALEGDIREATLSLTACISSLQS